MTYQIEETKTQRILWVYAPLPSLVAELTVDIMKLKNCDVAHIITS